MNVDLLRKHISKYMEFLKNPSESEKEEMESRHERAKYYQSWTKDRILQMREEDLYEYIAQLWALIGWHNKRYVIENIIKDNGLDVIRHQLASFVWGSDSIEKRWDNFRNTIKRMGPAMMSEILCHTHPKENMCWNRRAYVALNYLGIENLPRYDYQITGKVYSDLSRICKKIEDELKKAGVPSPNLLTVDYLIWYELQVEENLSQIHRKKGKIIPRIEAVDQKSSDFIHDEIRDKLAKIGNFLGFESQTERKIAEGSKVDAIWEIMIGNMNIGRIMYVFEVQTKGSIDSLLINLQKALQNPSVQGVVAVSDEKQLEKIKKEVATMGENFRTKIKYWDYENVLQVCDNLESTSDALDRLGLVPKSSDFLEYHSEDAEKAA